MTRVRDRTGAPIEPVNYMARPDDLRARMFQKLVRDIQGDFLPKVQEFELYSRNMPFLGYGNRINPSFSRLLLFNFLAKNRFRLNDDYRILIVNRRLETWYRAVLVPSPSIIREYMEQRWEEVADIIFRDHGRRPANLQQYYGFSTITNANMYSAARYLDQMPVHAIERKQYVSWRDNVRRTTWRTTRTEVAGLFGSHSELANMVVDKARVYPRGFWGDHKELLVLTGGVVNSGYARYEQIPQRGL